MTDKLDTLIEMGKIIKKDLSDVVNSVYQVAKYCSIKTVKAGVYLVSTPFIGPLSEYIKDCVYPKSQKYIYGHPTDITKPKLGRAATFMSMITNLFAYSYLGELVTGTEYPYLGVAIGLSLGTIEGICRAKQMNNNPDINGPGSIIGYVPSKIAEYFIENYYAAKRELEIQSRSKKIHG